jgi:hypothetical protein
MTVTELPYAWVVVLTHSSYLPGVIILSYSLHKVGSRYPLIVAVPQSLPRETINALQASGLCVRYIELLRPKVKVEVVATRFEDTWSKLAVFKFEEYKVSACQIHQRYYNEEDLIELNLMRKTLINAYVVGI